MVLFPKNISSKPLAERARPKNLREFVGQENLVGDGKILRKIIKKRKAFSMIFWGPPGTGKTTIAKIISRNTQSEFLSISAVSSGVKDVRNAIKKAELNKKHGRETIFFIDEIHRFSKNQQDALLHKVEDGTIILIGATTENPSFEVISPLLSRCHVLQFKYIKEEGLKKIIKRVIEKDSKFSEKNIKIEKKAEEELILLSGGDARILLNILELSISLSNKENDQIKITKELVRKSAQQGLSNYSKKGDAHYNITSAFIKSIRGSDPNAAVYWLARMLDGGEDPKFIARRLVILASEDIGNANPGAISLATNGFTAVNYVGMPESRIILSQIVTYLSCSKKSNASYKAINQAQEDAKNTRNLGVPLHLRNAPTKLMEKMDYGKNYKYPHDHENHFIKENYLPEKINHKKYYVPTKQGDEEKFSDRLKKLWPNKYSN